MMFAHGSVQQIYQALQTSPFLRPALHLEVFLYPLLVLQPRNQLAFSVSTLTYYYGFQHSHLAHRFIVANSIDRIDLQHLSVLEIHTKFIEQTGNHI